MNQPDATVRLGNDPQCTYNSGFILAYYNYNDLTEVLLKYYVFPPDARISEDVADCD